MTGICEVLIHIASILTYLTWFWDVATFKHFMHDSHFLVATVKRLVFLLSQLFGFNFLLNGSWTICLNWLTCIYKLNLSDVKLRHTEKKTVYHYHCWTYYYILHLTHLHVGQVNNVFDMFYFVIYDRESIYCKKLIQNNCRHRKYSFQSHLFFGLERCKNAQCKMVGYQKARNQYWKSTINTINW